MNPEILDQHRQRFNKRTYFRYGKNRYFQTSTQKNKIKTWSKLHRDVWEHHNGKIPDDLMIDHIDRDTSNNHISNLRLVTAKQNRENIDPKTKAMYSQRMAEYNSQQSGKWWQDPEKKKQRSKALSKSWENRAIEKNCLLCNKIFIAKHNSATYCSKECRQENYFRNGVKLWKRKITK